jgi:hypothetical protein
VTAIPKLGVRCRQQANVLFEPARGRFSNSGRFVAYPEVTPFWSYFLVGGKPGAIWTITPPSLRQTSPWIPGHISGQRFETLDGLILEPSEFVPKLTLCETRRAWLWSASCRYTSSAFARPVSNKRTNRGRGPVPSSMSRKSAFAFHQLAPEGSHARDLFFNDDTAGGWHRKILSYVTRL